jgi:outer membrane receptor for monomeric catechols
VQPTFAAPAEATSSAEQSPKAIEEVRKPTAAAPGVKSGKAIEEIAVTARKREENLQETPVSISAFSAEDLRDADVRNLNDITRTVPNLQFDNPIGTANSARIYLRGVGPGDPISSNDLPRDPQSVADIEPVEVLRGPQGTLFGKNTIGGAVNVVTKKPEADATAPAPLDLATPIQLAPPSPERLRELQAQRGNDMAEVLPPLGSATLDPCASPERVGAAVPAEAADQASRVDARCPRDER